MLERAGFPVSTCQLLLPLPALLPRMDPMWLARRSLQDVVVYSYRSSQAAGWREIQRSTGTRDQGEPKSWIPHPAEVSRAKMERPQTTWVCFQMCFLFGWCHEGSSKFIVVMVGATLRCRCEPILNRWTCTPLPQPPTDVSPLRWNNTSLSNQSWRVLCMEKDKIAGRIEFPNPVDLQSLGSWGLARLAPFPDVISRTRSSSFRARSPRMRESRRDVERTKTESRTICGGVVWTTELFAKVSASSRVSFFERASLRSRASA